jgi:hypothetical protein
VTTDVLAPVVEKTRRAGPEPGFFVFAGQNSKEMQMTTESTTKNLFKPPVSKAESKAQATDRAFREIVNAEESARSKKTEKLREARLKQTREAAKRLKQARESASQ